MTTINLKDFYPWYLHDEFVEVPDEIAAELLANRRYEKASRRRIYRNKAQYSLDVDDGIESCTSFVAMTPYDVLEYKETFCRLCRALNSLSDIQARRIEAFFVFGMTKADIARAEGVAENAVKESIKRGLKNMKKYFKDF